MVERRQKGEVADWSDIEVQPSAAAVAVAVVENVVMAAPWK